MVVGVVVVEVNLKLRANFRSRACRLEKWVVYYVIDQSSTPFLEEP